MRIEQNIRIFTGGTRTGKLPSGGRRSDRSSSPSGRRNRVNRYREGILRALLYYDIWDHPLTAEELYAFLPFNSVSFEAFLRILSDEVKEGNVRRGGDFYFAPWADPSIAPRREARARHAERLWKTARLSMHVIKRFPFVRAVFVSGDLSKGVTSRTSDIDFFIITSPNRLWIARTLLILFKKLFLLNRKKYFCVNYFATEDHLAANERNIYVATEIATLQPLFNAALFRRYLEANRWVKNQFPNFDVDHRRYRPTSEHRSVIQHLLERGFELLPADRIDSYLMRVMENIWARRYPGFDAATRSRVFRSTRHESRAFVGNFEDKVLALYEQRLRRFGFEPDVRESTA